jgi:hypothetical protein
MRHRSVHLPTAPSYLLTKVSHQLVRCLTAVTCVGVTLLASSPARRTSPGSESSQPSRQRCKLRLLRVGRSDRSASIRRATMG